MASTTYRWPCLINRASLIASLGGKPTPEAIEKQLSEVEQLVASAAGAHKERGDAIKIAAVDFVDAGQELEPQPPPPVTEMLVRQSGNVLNAVTILVVTLLLIWFGLRPAARAIFSAPALAAGSAEIVRARRAPRAPSAAARPHAQLGGLGSQSEVSLIEDLTSNPRRSPQKRLEQIVEYDEEQAAAILRQWMRQGDAHDAASGGAISCALRRAGSSTTGRRQPPRMGGPVGSSSLRE